MTKRALVISFPLSAVIAILAESCSSSSPHASDQPVAECPGAMCGIVAAHNAVRTAAPNADPPLANLSWDETLAGHAQAWADTCPSGHNPNRIVNGQSVGENIFFSSIGTAVGPGDVVQAWASESASYDITANTCNGAAPTAANLACGHYTQLVWRATTSVGCGTKLGCAERPQIWVCDYVPPGNMLSNGVIGPPY